MIYASIEELIGKTPLMELKKYGAKFGFRARVIAKLEQFNPSGSVKDRAALSMIDAAEKAGVIKKGATLIEPTSGNTGVGLAMIAASRGYKLILTMPETMSVERRRLAAAYGAEIVLTEGAKGMAGAIAEAERLRMGIDGSFIPSQFDNPANPKAHEKTAKEILEETGGKIDVLVAGVGTGGTLCGTARALKKTLPNLEVVAVEPETSAVLSGEAKGAHGLQGIGAGFIPANYDASVVDKIIKVKDEDAFATASALAKTEGVFTGISAGAALSAAEELARNSAYSGKTIVVILPDSGDRYLSVGIY